MFATGPTFFQTATGAYPTLALAGTFASATVGVSYSSSLSISGGLAPYSLTGGTGVASGTLPGGLSLSISGSTLVLSGTPTTAATNTFTASVGSADSQTATSAQSVLVYASNVVLAVSMQGVEGGTTFVDTSSNNFAINAFGGIVTKTAGVPGGGSATYFNGTGNLALGLPLNAMLNNFGTGDYSISVEAYSTDTTVERTIFSNVVSWTSSVLCNLEVRASGDLRYYAGNSVPIAIIGGAGSFSANTWHTVKVARVSGVTTLTIDGTTVGSPHTGSVSLSSTEPDIVGTLTHDSTQQWKGYQRNLVITKG
ncbi:MAG TPA: putative Ig domain-containing protein [Telluria sp.]|nr:putative Ig domain-containing protein [Telluria sp.]